MFTSLLAVKYKARPTPRHGLNRRKIRSGILVAVLFRIFWYDVYKKGKGSIQNTTTTTGPKL